MMEELFNFYKRTQPKTNSENLFIEGKGNLRYLDNPWNNESFFDIKNFKRKME